jgi:glyoxylase-like metal-dependent hydrolase (beta-lactamase superfamily II)
MREPQTIDLHYLDRPQAIAACLLELDEGVAIVDPGPSASLDALYAALEERGLGIDDIRALLLTHIHLDHAGAAGTLAREQPELRVYVHERGARHLADPSKLLASARRIYGGEMERLFGDFEAVPADRLVALTGGERLDIGGRVFLVVDAPGHAKHHVALLDEATGTVFLGDTVGERFAPATHVLPVTPPPDIDLERWEDTLARVRAWQPASIFVTHFGRFGDPALHFDEFETRLMAWAHLVLQSLSEPGDDAEKAERFAAGIMGELRDLVAPEHVVPYMNAGIAESWTGLARYWRTRPS